MEIYCSKCGAKLILKKKSKPVYSTDLPNHVPFYTVDTYCCPRARLLFWPFSNHDCYEVSEETDEYIKAKKEYDKTHRLPLPDATLIRRNF